MVSRADCPDCGYFKEDLFVGGLRGSKDYPIKGCRKCKMIISLPKPDRKDYRELNECPICHGKDLIDYKWNKKDIYECPKCSKKNLKFTMTIFMR